ncbi:IS110 family transposase [Spiribacter halobius]|nr:IS110 family transposase [Spiribacter halobius]UEX78350.1 IS110 family transposase [Spiribacter halobius]
MCNVGVDIAAASFELVTRKAGRHSPSKRFEQTPQGHRHAIAHLQRLAPERIVLEATGVYFLDLALALHQAGLPVCVINPRAFKHFAELKLTGSKTDPIDAALLADYAECMHPPLWQPPRESALALRELGRQVNRLVGERTQAKNRLHALGAKQATPALVIDDEREGIAALDRRIERLRAAALELINADATLQAQFRALTAAVGVGEVSAITLIAELCTLPEQLKAKQVARHAGLDVRLNQSGTSVARPGRLSKAGNAYLRAALFMPAMVAIQNDPYAKAFYEALIARGKKRIQAICAVMRKYLTGIWACFKTQQPFDSSQLFSRNHMQKA